MPLILIELGPKRAKIWNMAAADAARVRRPLPTRCRLNRRITLRQVFGFVGIALCVPLLFSAGAASARNYDCTKAGNANKAACKAAAAPVAAAKPAPAARNYDCTKAGNANKAACKAAAAPVTTTKPAPAPTPTARNYDCTKAGNANKTACKGASSTATGPVPTAKPAPMARPAPTAAAAPAQPGKPTAQCKDGTYSMSQHRSGTCSHHGGVANWLANLP
jgi:hypothetical protein